MTFSKNRLIIGAVLVAAIAGIILVGINGKATDREKNVPRYREVTVRLGTYQEIVTADGEVKPINRIEIKSKASGEIVALPVEEGDFVHKGDLLARLGRKDEASAVAQAEADLGIAKAELKQAQRMFERRDQLYRKKIISEEERDEIGLKLAVAKGKVIQTSTVLDRAKERLSESIVRAPIDGIILQKYVEEGQIIASGLSNVSGGTPIVDIAAMHSVYIEAGVNEIDIGKIEIGQRATVVA
ncbi:MAG: efflux RND transporter periplasmic adaptor subunit, partial [Nitrospiria bacterium]